MQNIHKTYIISELQVPRWLCSSLFISPYRYGQRFFSFLYISSFFQFAFNGLETVYSKSFSSIILFAHTIFAAFFSFWVNSQLRYVIPNSLFSQIITSLLFRLWFRVSIYFLTFFSCDPVITFRNCPSASFMLH